MDTFEPKKLLILRIYQILNEYSDADHKLKQADIIAYLARDYGIECERKAIARNIEYLKQAGIDIVQDRGDGYYLAERRFEHGELRFLTDSVIANRNVCEAYTKEIIRKLVKEGGVYYKNYARCVDLGDWRKSENKEYFLNIELLSEAIEKKVKVTLRFMHYGVDKQLHARKPDKETVNPYKLFFKNGHYYLACNVDKYDQLIFCRIDKIAEIELTGKTAQDRLRGGDGRRRQYDRLCARSVRRRRRHQGDAHRKDDVHGDGKPQGDEDLAAAVRRKRKGAGAGVAGQEHKRGDSKDEGAVRVSAKQ